MLTRGGVKVLDFGLAKLRPSPEHGRDRAPDTRTALPLTGEGVLLGTVPYMAPEQLEGHSVDGRTDIFAFGAIVHEMTAGRRAFAGDSQASLIAAILEREPEPISGDQPLTPPGLERLVRKCLAKDPDARWQSASDIADELRWLSKNRRSPRCRRRRFGVDLDFDRRRLPRPSCSWPAWQLWLCGRIAKSQPGGPRREARYTQATFAGDVQAAALSPTGGRWPTPPGDRDGTCECSSAILIGGQSLEIGKGTAVTN